MTGYFKVFAVLMGGMMTLAPTAWAQTDASNSAGTTILPHPVKDPVTYVGRVRCEHIELVLSQLKDSLPRAFCEQAVRGCLSLHHLDKLDPTDPLRLEMEEALDDKVSLDINICELGIKHFDPDFYEKNLKRP